jgi:hypothetical protein
MTAAFMAQSTSTAKSSITVLASSFLAHGLEFGLGLGAVGGFKNHIEDLALSDGIDAGKTKAAERMLDGLALRVENAVLERDRDACLDH